MAEDLQATTVSKAYVDNILESMSELLIVADPQLQIQLVNRAALEQLEFTSQELVGQPLAMLFAGHQFLAVRENAIPHEWLGVHEHVLLTKGSRPIPVHWAGSQLQDPSGALQGIVCIALNIAERKLVEERLRASLDEKEVLLKEVHHRVKNNLQVISSLLALQGRETADPEASLMFADSQGRIRSMALIHEQLYLSGDLSRIDFSEYVRRLCLNLMDSSGASDSYVALHIDVDPVPLPLDLAIPCGMILNELVSNALKHAFTTNAHGQVNVKFHRDGNRHTLSVSDNGVGIRVRPQHHKTSSLGLKIVHALVKQLDGQLDVKSVAGSSFTISFDCVTDLAAAPRKVPSTSAS
jgi:PAS domain S-box-containing protein